MQICKIGDSPVNSPGSRRGSIAESSSSSRSQDRLRTCCVVPSPLAATNTIDDDGPYFKPATLTSASRERKDFSRLFVPIPPSPGAMDCCMTTQGIAFYKTTAKISLKKTIFLM